MSKTATTTKSDYYEAMRAELQRFVDYYSKGRAGTLGNGEAYQHYERSVALLRALAASEDQR